MDQVKPQEKETAEFAFEIYAENGELDATLLGRFMYCMGINPSLERLKKFGLSEKKGEKKFKLDEVLPVYVDLKKEVKDMGCYEDFIECLKLYDKNNDGTMPLGDLHHALVALGEKLTNDEVEEVFEDCMDEEDDEGQIVYTPFLRRMCELDPPLKPKKK